TALVKINNLETTKIPSPPESRACSIRTSIRAVERFLGLLAPVIGEGGDARGSLHEAELYEYQ
ncbi:hypothetical protein FQN49_002444, partial [Arthroderma sp. PD_2]